MKSAEFTKPSYRFQFFHSFPGNADIRLRQMMHVYFLECMVRLFRAVPLLPVNLLMHAFSGLELGERWKCSLMLRRNLDEF